MDTAVIRTYICSLFQLGSEKFSASPRGSRRASESAAVGSVRRKRADYDHLEVVPQATQLIREDVDGNSSEDSSDSPK